MTQKTYQRFSLTQRTEHILMLTSFTVLSITGLPQKFISADWAQTMIGWMGGIEATRQIHHFAAIVLMLASVYHLVAVGYQIFVRHVRLTMLPGLNDATEAIDSFLYNLGLKKEAPQSGRYNYAEKAEYWAFVWGTLVMIITGFIMWNPIATASLLPGQVIPAAKSAHGGEALLAVLAIILWHFYHVHLRSFNKSMWTGKLNEHEMAEEHPLELADIKAGIAHTPVDETTLKKRRQVYIPIAGVMSVALLFGIYQFVTFEQTAIETLPVRLEQVEAFAPLAPTALPTRRPTPTSAAMAAIWEGNIADVLQNKCSECHGTVAGFDVSSYESIMAGGKSGPAIIPGDPENSLFVIKQSKKHPGRLSDSELQVIKDWIAAGAPEK